VSPAITVAAVVFIPDTAVIVAAIVAAIAVTMPLLLPLLSPSPQLLSPLLPLPQ
jgi:hypothetical protein